MSVQDPTRSLSVDRVEARLQLPAALSGVRAPSLFIVGGWDTEVLALNQATYRELACRKELAIVPAATILFEQPGILDAAANLAADWFERDLPGGAIGTAQFSCQRLVARGMRGRFFPGIQTVSEHLAFLLYSVAAWTSI